MNSIGQQEDAVSVHTQVINVSDAHPTWHWLANRFADETIAWNNCSSYVDGRIAKRIRWPVSRLRASMRVRHMVRSHAGRSVIVSHGPLMTMYSEAFGRSANTLHLSFSFNFTALPGGVRRDLFRRYLKRVDRLVVASSMERDLYSNYFEIDARRIDLLLWSIQPPIGELSKPSRFGAGRYICAIGSQARDYGTLIESMRRIPSIPLVLVASADSLPECSIPPNVTIMTHVPLSDAMNVLAHSQFMVLPLEGSSVPCGHVTVVSALHMGKAILATNSSGLHDYLTHESNALLIPHNDPGQLAARIQLLFDKSDLCRRLGANGQAFAQANCTEENAVAYFRRFLNYNGIQS